MSCSKQKTGLNTSSEQVDGKCCHHGNDSNQLHDECQSKSAVDLTTVFFVFGYGGLLWKNSDLNFFAKIPGYIKGYARRFWQMNQFHRGTDENMGRVATLIPEEQGKVWGYLFKIQGQHADKARQMLDHCEITLGRYERFTTLFYPRDDPENPIEAFVYIATAENPLYGLEQDLDRMAAQVIAAKGACGPNTEYVLRIDDITRNKFPEAEDEHLFRLADRVRKLQQDS